MKKSTIKILITVILLYGCKNEGTQNNNSIIGTWKSIGNSWVLDIAKDSTYTDYDITDISCLVARHSHVDDLIEQIKIENDTLKLLRGAIEYLFSRMKTVPEVCEMVMSDKKLKDPIYNFEVFASTIRDNYAFMELNKIDWESLYSMQKARITASPNNITLYHIMDDMLIAINDNHGAFEASDKVYEALEAMEEDNEEIDELEILPEIGDFQISTDVAKHHLVEEMTEDSFILQWGRIANDIGYIQVKAMFLLTDLGMSKELIKSLGWDEAWAQTYEQIGEDKYIQEERKGMSRTMKQVMNDLKDMDKIIIDIRFNGGGQDLVSLEFLSWFNDQPRVIAQESLVYEDGQSPSWDIVLPSRENAFTKPVYLLTSQQTGSAAEVCAMATMVMPNVTRIGMPTMGALSTALEKKLPNGWGFAISNEYYRAMDGNIYENIGIPVDVKIDYPADRQEFFRNVMNNLDGDKTSILSAIGEHGQEN